MASASEDRIIAAVLATMPFVRGVYDWRGILFVWVTSEVDSIFGTFEGAVRVAVAPHKPTLTYLEPTLVYRDAWVIYRRDAAVRALRGEP